MKYVILDGETIHTREDLHRTLQEALCFPEWYGRNLDALHDVLTDISEKTVIGLIDLPVMEEHLGDYAVYFLRVLKDCAQENPHLYLLK